MAKRVQTKSKEAIRAAVPSQSHGDELVETVLARPGSWTCWGGCATIRTAG